MRLTAAAVALVFLLPAYSQDLPPLEAYGRLPVYDMYALSASGRYGASRITNDGQDAVMVFDLDTHDFVWGADAEEVNPRRLRFVDDDQLILIAGQTIRTFSVRNQFDYSSAYAMNLSTREIQVLLRRADDLYPYQSGLGNIVGRDPNSKSVYMPAWVEPRLGGAPVNGIYRVRLDKKRAKVVVYGNDDTIDWFLGEDGTPIVREDFDDDRNVHRIWTTDEKGRNKELIYESEGKMRTIGPVGLTAARDALVLLINKRSTGGTAYYLMSLADGEISGPVLDTEGREIERVITDINRVVYGVEFSGFKPSYQFFDKELDQRVRATQDLLVDAASRLVSWSDDFERLVFRVDGGITSGAYLLFDRDEARPKLLGKTRPLIGTEHIAPVAITSYAARDGMTIPALLTAHASVIEQGNAPLIVMPHGGPQAHDRYGFDWMAQYFAGRGYAVLQPQFRGSDGFGYDHHVAGEGEWGGMMQSDLDDGVTFLVDEGIANPERVCMVGASYGGYAALAAGAFSPDMYRCIAAFAPVSDLRRMLKRERSEHGKNHWVLDYWEEFYGADASEKEMLRSISPVFYAEQFEAPVLLIHGKKDTVVNIEQSKVMNSALRKADKDVTFIQLKGEDHWLTQEETRIKTLRALAEFIDTHL
jgi:dipeptidyl aminopeptidase/acylaminoacyl peptidase